MALQERKLIAPNSLAIAGIKLTDGSISAFEYSCDVKTRTSFYVLPEGIAAPTATPAILVDIAGNEWPSEDVEFHSLLRSK